MVVGRRIDRSTLSTHCWFGSFTNVLSAVRACESNSLANSTLASWFVAGTAASVHEVAACTVPVPFRVRAGKHRLVRSRRERRGRILVFLQALLDGPGICRFLLRVLRHQYCVVEDVRVGVGPLLPSRLVSWAYREYPQVPRNDPPQESLLGEWSHVSKGPQRNKNGNTITMGRYGDQMPMICADVKCLS